MKDKKEKRNPIGRLLRMLVEARWFFAVTASGVATILGISLTFGINSCREQQRQQREIQKSLLQAVDNLSDRFEYAQIWMEMIEKQNEIYSVADSINSEGGSLADSICDMFRRNMVYILMSTNDHEYEKIFRGSYQLWQLQNNEDSLVYYIAQCYDGLNIVENTSFELIDSMLKEIGDVNQKTPFFRQQPREWTLALINNPSFQYYMSIRKVKSNIIGDILRQAKKDFDTNVIPRSSSLK